MGQKRPFSRAWLGVVALSVAVASVGATGCRVSSKDVERWEKTERGPFKLVAVVTHDKYDWDLRTQAALSLVRMPPRGGQRQGIKYLVDKYKDDDGETREGALTVLSEDARKQIVNGMAPELIKQMSQPPPPRDEKTGRLAVDPSIPYKDAAFAMLSHEPTLVSDEKTRAAITEALIKWTQTGFEDRIENGSQQYGVEQIMRFLGASSVKNLPDLINEQSYRIDRVAALVADIGDEDTKRRAGEAMVKLATTINSPGWVAQQTAIVQKHNAAQTPPVNATAEQVAGQVSKIQDRRLNEEIFPAMKKVGGRACVDYLLTFAADTKNPDERRRTALAALEGRVDKNSDSDLDRVFNIAKDDAASDGVRDIAFQRLGEFPKEKIVPKLYTLFEPKKWKVRWVAASLVLKTISTKGVPDFMAKLPKVNTVKMGMTEPLSYGQLIAKMEPPAGEPKPRDLINTYLQSKDFGPKMTAIGFFYEGKKADRDALKAFEEDKTPVPKCDAEDDCQWKCDVPKAGTKETESKEVTTVGDVVKLCVIPSMDK